MPERREAGRENQEDQPEKETGHSPMSSHCKESVLRGNKWSRCPITQTGWEGGSGNSKSLVNSDLMLSLDFCPEKVSIMGVFWILEKEECEDGKKKGYEWIAERTLGKLL